MGIKGLVTQAARRRRQQKLDEEQRRRLIELDKGGTLAQIADAAWNVAGSAFSTTLEALDAPRQVLQAGMWAATGKDLAEAWELAEYGSNLLGSEGLGWEAEEDSWNSWIRGAAGFVLDVATDPLTYVGIGSLTKAGKAAKKGKQIIKAGEVAAQAAKAKPFFARAAKPIIQAEKITKKAMQTKPLFMRSGLAATWAEQADLGQRALFTLARPHLKIWTPWKTVASLSVPKGVKALGATGRWLGEKAPIIKNIVRRFTTKSLDPRVNRLVDQVMGEHGNDAIKVVKWYDDAMAFTKKLRPEDFRAVRDYAEAYGRESPRFRAFLDDAARNMSPEIIAAGRRYAEVTEAFKKVAGDTFEDINESLLKRVIESDGVSDAAWQAFENAEKAGVLDAIPKKLRNEITRVRTLEDAGNRISGELAKGDALKSQLNKEVANLTGKITAHTMPRQATREMMRMLQAGVPWEGAAREAPVESIIKSVITGDVPVAELRRRLAPTMSKEQYASISVTLDRIDNLMKNPGISKRDLLRQQLDGQNALIAKARHSIIDDAELRSAAYKAMADHHVPNYIYSELTPAAKKELQRMGALAPGEAQKFWSSEMTGMYSRELLIRLDDPLTKNKPMGLRAVRDFAELAAKPSAERRAAWNSARFEKWNEFITKHGDALSGIDAATGRRTPGAAVDVGKMLDINPANNLTRMKDKLLDALRGKTMWQHLSKNKDLFSTAYRPGWTHIKEIDRNAARLLGVTDAWVEPAVFEELRRVYTNLGAKDSDGVLGRGWDTFTKFFKKTVTGPWPAYHVRNHAEDLVRMLYNGAYNPKTVHTAGWAGALGKKTVLDAGVLGKIPADEAYQVAKAYGVVNVGELASTTLDVVTTGKLQKAHMATRKVGAFLQKPEDVRRFGYFVDRLQNGYSPYQAAQEVKRVLFDYTDLSKFERQTMAQIIPFYSYLKNTIRLHAQTMIQRPALLTAQRRVIEGARGDAKLEDAPDWIRNRFHVALAPDKQTGEERLLSAYGLPLQDMAELLDGSGGFMDWFKDFSFRAHPALKAPFALGAAASGDRPARIYTDAITKGLTTEQKEQLGYRMTESGRTYFVMHPFADELTQLVAHRLYSSIKSGLRYGAPGFSFEGSMRLGTGLGITRYSEAEQRKKNARHAFQDALGRAMRRGDISQIPGFYKPKGSPISDLDYELVKQRRYELYPPKKKRSRKLPSFLRRS